MSRPSDGFTIDELREEFDWMYEFNSRMAEQIRGNPDVHSLNDYVRKIDAENANLRDQLAKARDPQRIGGKLDPESFVYAIEQLREFRWQHATNDEEAIPYINNVVDAHERENAKLRELVRDMWTDMCSYEHDCRMCAYFEDEYEAADGSFGHTGECIFLRRMHELGVEVIS